jgi:hypothetical protein
MVVLAFPLLSLGILLLGPHSARSAKVLYNTTQHSTTQKQVSEGMSHNTIQCNTIQYNTQWNDTYTHTRTTHTHIRTGIPAEVEIPAPVMTTTWDAWFSNSTNLLILRVSARGESKISGSPQTPLSLYSERRDAYPDDITTTTTTTTIIIIKFCCVNNNVGPSCPFCSTVLVPDRNTFDPQREP